ncbi:MAG: nickel-dependent hydrogenase large subunit [Deltaproteobacteria bacterium]|nr:nickel-dependent hydrogenase large subunit [Deltaproteobacteria bacterium]
MAKTIIIDPITRIEGHLKIEVNVDKGKVVDAKSSGTLWRGFERILIGRDPRDPVILTQRICGVCPTGHAMASVQCIDDAFDVVPPENARIIRNLIQGANYIQSHVLHFYHLAALDYVKGPDAPPFIPRYEGDYRFSKELNDELVKHYVKALEIRLKAHELLAVFGGKMPHSSSIVAGGVSCVPDVDRIADFFWRLNELRDFIDNFYLPDVIKVAETYSDYFSIGIGCKNLLSYGVFDLDSKPDVKERKRLLSMGRYTDGMIGDVDPKKITEDVKHSWYSSKSNLHPSKGETEPDPQKSDAYSWLKSPRYDGKVHEVGPLARMAIAHLTKVNATVSKLIEDTLSHFKADISALFSVLGRHAARALECKFVADEMAKWVLEIKPDKPVYNEPKIPDKANGMGLWEPPRGALGHWMEVRDKKISRYQCVVPTTWNASPRDDKDQPGPIEQALIGAPVPDTENPFSVVRIVRSFDPCIACAVHIIEKDRIPKVFEVC